MELDCFKCFKIIALSGIMKFRCKNPNYCPTVKLQASNLAVFVKDFLVFSIIEYMFRVHSKMFMCLLGLALWMPLKFTQLHKMLSLFFPAWPKTV